MAKIEVRFNCGCGYGTSKLEEAVQHSDSEAHTLIAQGLVRKTEQKKKKE